MTEEKYTKDMLMDAAGDRVDRHLNERMMVGGKDNGLEDYFQYEEGSICQGFRIVELNTILQCHGYTFGVKSDMANDIGYTNLPQEKKDAIPENETIFMLTGTLKTGEVTTTHWLREQCNFAQRVACDWWDNAEGEVLNEWGIEYDSLDEN